MIYRAVVALVHFLVASPLLAQTDAPGQVELPLEVYDRLIEAARDPEKTPRPAPASFALGSARVQLTVDDGAKVDAQLTIDVLDDDWVLVPVLPAATAVESATVGNAAVQLIATPSGLAWATRGQGSHAMKLGYRLDSARTGAGRSLAVPLPRASSIRFEATLPGIGLDVALIPSAGMTATEGGGVTRVRATLPAAEGVQLSWRLPAASHALSRATYTGRLAGDAVRWQGELTVELLDAESLTLPLLPSSVTLTDLAVDGKDATILLEGDRFATLLRGRGRHTVTAGFEVPIERQDGPPRIALEVPPVPVSRFELTLPGDKEVTVEPASSVRSRRSGDVTVATAHVPLTSKLLIAWTEAVPEDELAEVRASAAVYHAVHAEEGVLYVEATAEIEVNRGETHVLRLEVPADVQVDRVTAGDAVVDWRLGEVAGDTREITVFLDRRLQGRLVVEVGYDRSITVGDGDAELTVPLLRALDAQRQRGMVALLAGPDLVLEPTVTGGVVAGGATRVGENQLPAFMREGLELPVAHTFKYVETPPRLTVEARVPQRRQGRFDARVDTLASIGEVTLKATAAIEIEVKSGRLMELELTLPEGVSLLGLTGPSIRQHRVEPAEGAQRVLVDFTQEMDGRFRLEAAYERLLDGGQGAGGDVEVPILGVSGAEVAQGRLAVEALAAVEVEPSAADGLTSLDAAEIPQRLVLLTTHPILHAYRYAGVAPRLALRITRHQAVDVHQAAIDRADVRTLFTRDGLSVTAARFAVRNSGRQFLRLRLPPGSEVWSAFVDGRAEKPALSVGDDGREEHLIRIIHSTRGFDVEVVYQTPAAALRGLGTLSAVLPRPEVLITRTRWDVYLPEGVGYGKPSGGMEVAATGDVVTAEDLSNRMSLAAGERLVEPLRPVIPSAGIHFAFEKLYANQAERDAGFTLPYASGPGRALGRVLSFAGAALFWVGIAFIVRSSRRWGTALALGGLVLLAVLVGRYQLGVGPAVCLSVLLLLSVGVYASRSLWQR